MDWENITQCICIILTGAATAIPLVLKLIEYVAKAAREKSWTKLLALVLELMESAEGLFEEGQLKKAYVKTAVGELAERVGCELSQEELDELIDGLCKMSRVVNAG